MKEQKNKRKSKQRNKRTKKIIANELTKEK